LTTHLFQQHTLASGKHVQHPSMVHKGASTRHTFAQPSWHDTRWTHHWRGHDHQTPCDGTRRFTVFRHQSGLDVPLVFILDPEPSTESLKPVYLHPWINF